MRNHSMNKTDREADKKNHPSKRGYIPVKDRNITEPEWVGKARKKYQEMLKKERDDKEYE